MSINNGNVQGNVSSQITSGIEKWKDIYSRLMYHLNESKKGNMDKQSISKCKDCLDEFFTCYDPSVRRNVLEKLDRANQLNDKEMVAFNCLSIWINLVNMLIYHIGNIYVKTVADYFNDFCQYLDSSSIRRRMTETILYCLCNYCSDTIKRRKKLIALKHEVKQNLEKCVRNHESDKIKLSSAIVSCFLVYTNKQLVSDAKLYMKDIIDRLSTESADSYLGINRQLILLAFEGVGMETYFKFTDDVERYQNELEDLRTSFRHKATDILSFQQISQLPNFSHLLVDEEFYLNLVTKLNQCQRESVAMDSGIHCQNHVKIFLNLFDGNVIEEITMKISQNLSFEMKEKTALNCFCVSINIMNVLMDDIEKECIVKLLDFLEPFSQYSSSHRIGRRMTEIILYCLCNYCSSTIHHRKSLISLSPSHIQEIENCFTKSGSMKIKTAAAIVSCLLGFRSKTLVDDIRKYLLDIYQQNFIGNTNEYFGIKKELVHLAIFGVGMETYIEMVKDLEKLKIHEEDKHYRHITKEILIIKSKGDNNSEDESESETGTMSEQHYSVAIPESYTDPEWVEFPTPISPSDLYSLDE